MKKPGGRDPFVVLLILAGISLMLVESRLVKLQLVERPFWELEARKSRVRARSLPFERGWILDRHKRPLAFTQSLFELRFVFRYFRLRSPAGQVSMVYFLMGGVRPPIVSIYDDPGPYLEKVFKLSPEMVLGVESQKKRRDLMDYLIWLFRISEEEETALFKSDEAAGLPFSRIPLLAGRMMEIQNRIIEEGKRITDLEALLQVEEGTLLDAPDKAAARADRLVAAHLKATEGNVAVPSYLTLRKYHKRIDAYEITVLRDIPHTAVRRITIADDLFPGFYIVASAKRAYPEAVEEICPLLVGKTGLPNERELRPRMNHLRRLEELSLIEEKTEEEMIEEESLRLKVRELDIRPDEEVGRLGLEAVLEPVLRGKRGYILEERGSPSGGSRVVENVPPIRGMDVILTLDSGLQKACERALADSGYAGAVVIMEAGTGAILAMATTPNPTRSDLSFQWNKLLNDKTNPLMHRAVYNENLPPPGSVFKLVTAVAALEEDLCGIDQTFLCEKRIPAGNRYLHCDGFHGEIGMMEALVHSCNIYFYRLGAALGYDTLFDWAERFGFGQPTGYLDRSLYGLEGTFRGFPEGAGGLNRNARGRTNLMRLAIGQTAIDDVTPLQVARMAAGIATGKLPFPHLISRIGDRSVEIPPPVDLGISHETLAFVRQAMIEVVTRGTADPDPSLARDLRPFHVAGKTGTPQVDQGASHAFFVGFLPWDAPKWSFAVFLESCGLHGGEAAAPVLNRILESPEAEPYRGGEPR